MTEALAPGLAAAVLDYLDVAPGPPDLALLDRLIAAYGRAVPWESASRIVRHAATPALAARPRWSEEFWREAMASGTGGTCFESNRAALALLRALGYEGYLTINNMNESVGCHTAIVVVLGGQRWLLDAGYPIYAALRLDPAGPTERHTPYFTYTVSPLGPGRYVVENTPHPHPYLFDLLDAPVEDAAYCAATTADYGEGGLFLDRMIIRKIVGGRVWRFDGDDQPWHLQCFEDGRRSDHPIAGDVPAALSQHFGIALPVVAAAWELLAGRRPAGRS